MKSKLRSELRRTLYLWINAYMTLRIIPAGRLLAWSARSAVSPNLPRYRSLGEKPRGAGGYFPWTATATFAAHPSSR
jgi:hypothetical protein